MIRDWFAQGMFLAAAWLAVLRVRPRPASPLPKSASARIYRLADWRDKTRSERN